MTAPARPWIGVRFDCCRVYARVSRAPGETRYRVVCPRCGRRAVIEVRKDGVDCRFFIVR